jgi:GNAT superfamily N-acetyltransferase
MKKIEGITINHEPNATKEDKIAAIAILREFNRQFYPQPQWQAVNIFARDVSGKIVGGIFGEIGCGWLHIEILAVNKELRSKGIGSTLLEAAEQEGKRQGSIGVYLETFEFQAKEFYERHSYAVFGVQESYPIGFKRYFMQKLFNNY